MLLLWTPSPSPSPAIPAPVDDLPSGIFSGVGGLGAGHLIAEQINSWFADLVFSALKPLLDALAASLLTTPNLAGEDRVQDLSHAMSLLSNSAFALLVLAAGVMVMGYETVQTRYAFKEIAPRLVVAFVASNFSFFLTTKTIDLANAISLALLTQDFNTERAANSIRELIVPPEGMQVFYIMLELVAIILLVLLLITFIFRAAMTTLLVIAAPLALACLALPQLDGLARLWWRSFCGLLITQVAQTLTLVTAVRIFFNQDGREAAGVTLTGQLYNHLLALCLLIILVRIPRWTAQMTFLQGGRPSMIRRIITTAIAYKVTSPVLAALHVRGGRGKGPARAAVTKTAVAKVLPAWGAPAGVATAKSKTVATAAHAARGGPGPVKHAPVGARRPANSNTSQPALIKHAPTGPPIAGSYRSATPRPKPPVTPSVPVYGYPRENFYTAGPAGLVQMQNLRMRGKVSPPPPRRAVEAPKPAKRPAPPIVRPDAPIPGAVEWPENPGRPRRRTRKPQGGDKR